MFTSKKVVVAVATIAGVFLLASCSSEDIVDNAGSESGQVFEHSDPDQGADLVGDEDLTEELPVRPETEQEPDERDDRSESDDDPAPPPVPNSSERVARAGDEAVLPPGFPSEVPLIEGDLISADEGHGESLLAYMLAIRIENQNVESVEPQAVRLLESSGFFEDLKSSETASTGKYDMKVFLGGTEVQNVFLTVQPEPGTNHVLVAYMVEIPV